MFNLADPIYVNKRLDAESEVPEPIDESYLSPPNYNEEGDPTIFDHEGEEKSSSYVDVNYDDYLCKELVTTRSAMQHVSADLNRADSAAEYEMSKLAEMIRGAAIASQNARPMELMSRRRRPHCL